MKRRLISFFIASIIVAVIVNSIGSLVSLWQKRTRIKDREQVLVQERQKHDQLMRKLLQVQSVEYIEKQAREKLNMGKVGEYVVVLPETVTQKTPEVQGESNSTVAVPAWQQWVRLFF